VERIRRDAKRLEVFVLPKSRRLDLECVYPEADTHFVLKIEAAQSQALAAEHFAVTVVGRRMSSAGERDKAFNEQLRVSVVAIGGASADGREYGFICECGCDETVMLVLADYDLQGGAWLEGHRPTDSAPPVAA
jgi:hypothetical protein